MFSYKDLEKEYDLIAISKKSAISEEEKTEDFKYVIDAYLQLLIEKQGAFIGIKVKGEDCG